MENNYIDLETTGTNIFKCSILQVGLLLGNKEYNFKVKYLFKFDEIDQEEREGLIFNNITNQEELNEHNNNALTIQKVLKELKLLFDFESKKKYKRIFLSGWNSSSFDIPILIRESKKYNIDLFQYVNYHHRDVMARYMLLKELNIVTGLNLSKLHKELIGTIKEDNFHDALEDVKATRDLDNYFFNLINKEKLENEIKRT